MAKQKDLVGYWRAQMNCVAVCLFMWALVSFGFGIILVEPLNRISAAGIPLGFWFATQGSELCFVIIIFVYCYVMNRLEKKIGLDE
ncbi:MAG: DUF4212 domain-containing protein [Pseudomonadota bacterium]